MQVGDISIELLINLSIILFYLYHELL